MWPVILKTDLNCQNRPESKQEGPEALNRSPEYTGQNQTFNFKIWVIFDQGQKMTLTFDTH